MQDAFDRSTLDRLIDLGRRQGELTSEDLRRALPVARMSPEAIALVLIELEEAGIVVEPDEDLLEPGRALPSLPPGAALRDREPSPPPPPPPRAGAPATPGAAPAAPARPEAPRRAPGAHRAVAAACLVALALALLALLLLRG
ncbi:hypothetical protein OPKNFCMD_6157 [Methylobacterium crusticola]|uniref:RNA polymerase sigma factor 70 region 1.1 domain-containing protein n=2 Tax=Methylobacterium crusticola TaxID=1697972 RepID=A0ABQ4R6P2_9HYPH|nr:RNA polymerase sigma factor region1.1 domain-containing protein [Methylobacterium crusticola]GJD53382.1 hypothetical protein OPKNFCMD_6157 [Methylobacterium crusticola]